MLCIWNSPACSSSMQKTSVTWMAFSKPNQYALYCNLQQKSVLQIRHTLSITRVFHIWPLYFHCPLTIRESCACRICTHILTSHSQPTHNGTTKSLTRFYVHHTKCPEEILSVEIKWKQSRSNHRYTRKNLGPRMGEHFSKRGHGITNLKVLRSSTQIRRILARIMSHFGNPSLHQYVPLWYNM